MYSPHFYLYKLDMFDIYNKYVYGTFVLVTHII